MARNEQIVMPKVAEPVKKELDKIGDTEGFNSAGSPRPKVNLKNGAQVFLTRSLLKEIGDYDSEGRPRSNKCEEIQRAVYFTQLLDRWECGEFI